MIAGPSGWPDSGLWQLGVQPMRLLAGSRVVGSLGLEHFRDALPDALQADLAQIDHRVR